jgi:hypothetical protein
MINKVNNSDDVAVPGGILKHPLKLSVHEKGLLARQSSL